jgi:hypothetical protein
MSDDDILTPNDLYREHPCWGIQFQRAHRAAGDFIPHLRIGSRIFYRRSVVNKFLAENETQGGQQEHEMVAHE